MILSVGYSRELQNVHGHFEFLLCLKTIVEPSVGHYPDGYLRELCNVYGQVLNCLLCLSYHDATFQIQYCSFAPKHDTFQTLHMKVILSLHREMHRALSLLPRQTTVVVQQCMALVGSNLLAIGLSMYACMSLEIMIRNTLLGNEGSTPRVKGVQAVSISIICEGHVSRISQSLQNASSSKGVRPGLI